MYADGRRDKMAGYATNLGKCICGDSLEELESFDDGSISLVVTSPPFALQRQKSYGNEEQEDYVDWLCQFGEVVFKKLRRDGSLVIDIGGAYEKGQPSYSLYQFKVLIKMVEEIGFKLAEPFYWYNPSALPAPIEWVNKRKLRAKSAVNTVWWFCKEPHMCKADVRNVLTPYSKRMQSMIQNPDEFIKGDSAERPSGHVVVASSWVKDNGGAIPSNLLQYPNTESNSRYLRYCKKCGVKGHPARFPASLPEFFIKFLTSEGDLVVDIFGGSNTTGMVAESLNRKWQTIELLKEYVASSVFRFIDSSDDAQETYDRILSGEFVHLSSQISLFM